MKALTPATLTLGMFGVVGLLIAGYVVKSVFATVERPPVVAKTRNVPMPIADLAAGTKITEEHLGMGPVLEKDLTRDMLLANRVIVGRITKEKMSAAQPIRSSYLYEPGVTPLLPVADMMRAVTIDMRGSPAIVDGLVKPGDHVDVHFAPSDYRNDPRTRGGFIMTLLKGVKILAINKNFLQGTIDNERNTVTFELTPEEANILNLCHERGTLSVSYNPEGKGNGHIALSQKDRVTLEEVLGLEPVQTPEPFKPYVSQVYRGRNRTQLEFGKDNAVNDVMSNRTPSTQPQIYVPATIVPQNTDPSATPQTTPAAPPAGTAPRAPGGTPSAIRIPGSIPAIQAPYKFPAA